MVPPGICLRNYIILIRYLCCALMLWLNKILIPAALIQQLRANSENLECPCNFEKSCNMKNDSQDLYTTCLGVVPLAAGENFTLEGVKRACNRLKATTVTVNHDRISSLTDLRIREEWPLNTLFLARGDNEEDEEKCTYAYVDPKVGPDAIYYEPIPCDDTFFNKNFLEMVLCEASPWLSKKPNKKTPTNITSAYNCTCPCGFYMDHNFTCVGGFAACEPIANQTVMHMLCYAIKTTVAFPARLLPGVEPPRRWPMDTVFYIDNPFIEDPYCGYKDSFAGGQLVTNNCSIIFNETDLFAVLCYGYNGLYTGKCPKRIRSARCAGSSLWPSYVLWIPISFWSFSFFQVGNK